MALSNREDQVTISQMPPSQTIFFKIYFEEMMGTKEATRKASVFTHLKILQCLSRGVHRYFIKENTFS